jgi:hypothetical protein
VKPDGTFDVMGPGPGLAVASSIALKGKATGNNLEAEIGNNSCAAHLVEKVLRPWPARNRP